MASPESDAIDVRVNPIAFENIRAAFWAMLPDLKQAEKSLTLRQSDFC